MMYSKLSYWEKDVFFKPYDVIVIGAGIVGLSAAYFTKIKFPHSRIAVFERGLLPSGASTKNAGFACFGSPTELLADSKIETEEKVIERIRWRWQGIQLLLETLGKQAVDFDPCGGFELFDSKHNRDEVTSHLTKLNHWMQEATGQKEVYNPTKINEKEAIKIRIEGSLHPGKMMHAWIEKNKSVQNDLFFNSEIFELDSGFIRLKNGMEFQSKQVLIASNGFASQLLPLDIKPGRGLVLLSKPVDHLKWNGVFHYDEGYVYFRNVGNRLLLGGGRNKAFAEEQTVEFQTNPKLRTYLFDLSKRLLEFDMESQLEHEWTGIMGFSSTKTPIMSQPKPGIHIRAGLGGMGVAIGSAIGKSFAEMVEL